MASILTHQKCYLLTILSQALKKLTVPETEIGNIASNGNILQQTFKILQEFEKIDPSKLIKKSVQNITCQVKCKKEQWIMKISSLIAEADLLLHDKKRVVLYKLVQGNNKSVNRATRQMYWLFISISLDLKTYSSRLVRPFTNGVEFHRVSSEVCAQSMKPKFMGEFHIFLPARQHPENIPLYCQTSMLLTDSNSRTCAKARAFFAAPMALCR
ncbi:hypothetical protein GQR58_026596 [Nymphon striatum]|nr:hypothetical protein GQR58_026596 [Nymphon striatum]